MRSCRCRCDVCSVLWCFFFVGGSETIVRLATQPNEPVTGQLHLEQARCPLVVRPARLTARLVADPRSIGESTAHVLVPMVVATFGRQPFGAVPEVMFSQFRGHEGVDGLGGQGQIGRYLSMKS